MALVEVKAPALLVGEKRLDLEALAIPGPGHIRVGQIGDQEEGRRLVSLPEAEGHEGAIALGGEGDLGEIDGIIGGFKQLIHVGVAGAQHPLVLALYGGTAAIVVGLTVHRLRLTARQTGRALS